LWSDGSNESMGLVAVNVNNLSTLRTLGIVRCSQLVSLNISNLPALRVLDCRSNALTSLNIRACPELRMLRCGNSYLDPFVDGNNALTSLNVSEFSMLTDLDCLYISTLTSLRAVGFVPNSSGNGRIRTFPLSAPYYTNFSIAGCSLSAAALNQLYTDLGVIVAPDIASMVVSGNPGIAADNPTIATAKGWIVYGS